MNPEEEPTVDQEEQPVAYDTEGHPLYLHPVQAQSLPITQPVTRPGAMVASQAVHMAQPPEDEKAFVSDATKVKHDRSRQLYPTLNLSEGEYVIAVVKRHPIGLFYMFFTELWERFSFYGMRALLVLFLVESVYG